MFQIFLFVVAFLFICLWSIVGIVIAITCSDTVSSDQFAVFLFLCGPISWIIGIIAYGLTYVEAYSEWLAKRRREKLAKLREKV